MPQKLTDEQLVQIVDAEFSTALGAPGNQISTERAKAHKYYLAKPRGDEVDGQSQVVTPDVEEVVDGIMPSLLRIFTTADNLVSFDPVGVEDAPLAEQESDYVSYVFFKQNPAFLILYSWFYDALVMKNGVVKAYWDDSEVVTTERYVGLSEAEVLMLLEDEELEPIERAEREEEGVILHDIMFRRVSKGGRVRVECVPPEEYRVSADSRSLDPSGSRMVGHERPVKRSELLDMHFDESIVDSLPADHHVTQTGSPEVIARNDKADEQFDDAAHDRSQDEITLREAYIRVDADGDGRSELLQVYTANSKLLEREPADRQIFHVISPHPIPHKHFGRATAEKVMNIQDVNTTILRQTLDNLYHTNNPGHAVWEQGVGENTLDDLLTTRVGRIARFARPVGESWAPMAVPFTAQASFAMLEYFDRMKRQRTGIRADGEGLNPEVLKNIQTSVLAQVHDMSRDKIEAIARIFAETGIRSLFLHIHELVLKHQKKATVVRLRNQFVRVDPRAWRTRFDTTVNIGLGIGTREQNLIHLNAIWEKQTAMAQGGGMNLTVTPKNLYNTAAEIVKNANLKQPAMFFSDPGEQKAPPPSTEQQQLQRQALEVQQRQQQLDAERQQLNTARVQLESQKLQLDRQVAQAELLLERQRLASDERSQTREFALQQEAERNKLLLALEELKTRLTELELQSGQNVTGSRV